MFHSLFKKFKGSPSPQREKDPVCGMQTTGSPTVTYTYKGETYSFCSDHCRKQFEENPERYAVK